MAALHGGRAREGDGGSSISDATSSPPPFSPGSGLGVMPTQADVAALALPVASEQHLAGETGVAAMESGDTGRLGQTSRPSTVATSSEEPTQPFILSEGLAPVPVRLVSKILKGDFVDMAELLRDNLEAQRRGNLQEASAIDLSQSKRARREIPDLLSWVQCFGTYLAVIATKYPDRLRQLLAYQTLVVREARRCGGRGWLAYDTMFRQQVVGDQQVDWSKLNSSMYAVTFLAQSNRGKSCTVCLETDHSEEECALARPKQPEFRRGGNQTGPQQVSSPRPQAGAGGSGGRFSRGRERMICFAYNQGECVYPYCRFSHACLKCGSRAHPVVRCQATGPDRDGPRSSIREWRHPAGRDGPDHPLPGKSDR